jgi:hypothetical protein
MPQLTFPIAPDGLAVDVYVNVDATILVPLRLSGAPSPNPIKGRGFIDTGSDITVVSLPVLQQLGVGVGHAVTTHGISGPVPGNTYLVSLHILDAQRSPAGPWFSSPLLTVLGLALVAGVDVLVGLDVLRTCQLFVDGPGGTFTLDF